MIIRRCHYTNFWHKDHVKKNLSIDTKRIETNTHHELQVVVIQPLPLSPQDVHIKKKYSLQDNIIMETIVDWVDSQDVKIVNIATLVLMMEVDYSGMRKVHVFVKAQSNAPTVIF
jgi:hypothetical protein